jgi:hypothetical protein
MSLVQKAKASNGANPLSSPITVTGNFTGATTAGNTLVAICYGNMNNGGSGSATIPTVNPPTTAGITWVLRETLSFTAVDFGSTDDGFTVALYDAIAAPSINSSTATSFVADFTGIGSCTAWLYLIEFSGGVSAFDVGATATGASSTIPATANLATSFTDLVLSLFVIAQSPTSTPGAGYTFVTGMAYDIAVQYQSGVAAGSISTAWGSSGDSGDQTWGCIAVSYQLASSTALNMFINGTPLVIPYELVAYQGATLTGPNAYSCGPPIIRGIYQTPVFTHA